MVELGVAGHVSMDELMRANGLTHSVPVGTKPVLVFNGSLFGENATLKRVRNLLTDFFRWATSVIGQPLIFRGESPEKIRLQGVELVMTFTAVDETTIRMNVHK